MLRALLAKDLRRARRNPLPWIINLIVPLAMTALIGFAFGGKSEGGALGKVRFALVDEDKSVLSEFLRGAAGRGNDNQQFEPVLLERAEALRLVNANEISAVVIIPTNFTRNYLRGQTNLTLELIKNPAESIHPAVIEELLGVAVAGLNVLSRNFNSEFPELQTAIEGKSDYHQLATLVERVGEKLKNVRSFIDPPLATYVKNETNNDAKSETKSESTGEIKREPATTNQLASAKAPAAKPAPKKAANNGIFAYLLVGLAGMFLLFIGQAALLDLHRELRWRTFERFQTLHDSLLPFVASKVVFALVMILLASGILLGGGGLAFGIHWNQPGPMVLLVIGYAGFIAAFFSLIVAWIPDERHAGVINNLLGMALGIIGGCAFPPQQLPAIVRDHLTPLMPSFWFSDALRHVQSGAGTTPWPWAVGGLIVTSLILMILAAALFRRRFAQGARA